VVGDEVPAPDVHNQDQDDVGGDSDKGDENITEVRDRFCCVKYSYTVPISANLFQKLSRFTKICGLQLYIPFHIPIRSNELITCRIKYN
jgi:hypothetical protein